MKDSAKPEAELLFRLPHELGEGPLWDESGQTLYWVNIVAGQIWRSRLADGRHQAPESCSPSVRVAALGLDRSGNFIAALDEGLARFAWGERPQILAAPSFDSARVVYNDGKCGPDGAFWIGSKDRAHQSGLGRLERLIPDGRTELLQTDLCISNGLDWSPDGRWFYLADSPRRVIWRYSWDAVSGRLGGRRVWADGSEAPGVADGLAVDAEGCLWSARWGGSQLVRLSPEGEVLRRVAMPVSRVSSCCFGGPDLKTLYITSAYEDLGPDERRAETLAGSVFALRVPVPGRPAFRFAAG